MAAIYTIDGVAVTEEYWARHRHGDEIPEEAKVRFRGASESPAPGCRSISEKRPHVSLSAGVMPHQAADAQAKARAAGFTGISFNERGNMVSTSPGQRDGYLKHIGMFDRQRGYNA